MRYLQVFFTVLYTEFSLAAYLNVHSVFQTLLYALLAVFFVYYCVVLCDLSECFNPYRTNVENRVSS